MSIKEQIKRTYLRDAITEVVSEFGGPGRHKHHYTEYELKRYIYREEDIPEYRVAIPETLTPLSEEKLAHTLDLKLSIQTKFLTYVPTGRIIYDNTIINGMKPVLFEYRLKDSREIRCR